MSGHHITDRILRVLKNDPEKLSDDDYFSAFALELYRYQTENHSIYRKFSEKTASAAGVRDWRDIPYLPIHAFKSGLCPNNTDAALTFLSSGTTAGSVRSRHIMSSKSHYNAVIDRLFVRRLELDNSQTSFSSLIPKYRSVPESSLSYMVTYGSRHLNSENMCWANSGKKTDMQGLYDFLCRNLEERKRSVLVSTTLALHDFLEWMRQQNLKLKLRSGSVVMDTGGAKGMKFRVSRKNLLQNVQMRFGLPKQNFINEYGMSELSSQFYDVAGTEIKKVPAWCRVSVLNPVSMKIQYRSGKGLLRILDLANVWSCAFIQTEDVASIRSGGFSVSGRASGSGTRGCSLSYEEML